MKQQVVFIDPGHSPSDPGNVNLGLREADSTMQLAERTAHYIRLFSKEGNINSEPRIATVLSREGLESPSIGERTKHARKLKADWLLSIHTNSVVNPLAYGAECWVSDDGYYKTSSNQLAVSLLANLLKAGLIGRNRGIKLSSQNRHKGLGILDQVAYVTPAVLIEPAFASHPGERRKLLDPVWRETVARVMAAVIVKFLGVEPRTDLMG